VLVEYFLFKKMRYRFHRIDKSRRKFLAVENQLRNDSKWPPLCMHPSDVISSESTTEPDKQSPLSFAEILVEEHTDTSNALDHGASILNIFFEQQPSQEEIVENNVTQTSSLPNGGAILEDANSIQSVTCILKEQEITLNPKALTAFGTNAGEHNSNSGNNNNNNNMVAKLNENKCELEMSNVNVPRS
jgi:hypothetical protein